MRENTLQQKLSQSLHKFKDKFAIECGDRILTYREVDVRSNHIANWIIKRGIEQGTFIGILVDDRVEFICMMIGILKARCVFVPLDSTQPKERLTIMIELADIPYVFVDSCNRRQFAPDNAGGMGKSFREFISSRDLYDNGNGAAARFSDAPVVRYDPEDKIYIYFTSGTTGVPKAIVGKNKSLLHFIDWEIDTFALNEGSRISQFTNPGFDAFLRDVFAPLCSGGVICIPAAKDILLNSKELVNWIEQSMINLIHCVPALFRSFASDGLTGDNFKDLKFILLSGEKIEPTDLVNWFNAIDERIRLVNLWGTSETTLAKTCYFISKSDIHRERIPVGKPIRGARVVILDENMNICKERTVGELYIRTPYRTFGYYGEPELNRERFIPNPYNEDPNDLLHKTGDLGRLLPDGNIEFLGRNDRQVKVRGIRIELEEIESVISKHPLVKEAVVIEKNTSGSQHYLHAYVTQKEKNKVDEESFPAILSEYLSKGLPDYMIPSSILRIEEVPRTINGKVDYRRLATIESKGAGEVIPPRNVVEEKLQDLWSGILRIDKAKISVTKRFFELGGNSLNIMSLISKIHRKFDVRVSLAEIFNNPTIEMQAKIVEKTQKDKYALIETALEKEYYQLSVQQKRIYIIQQIMPESIIYNMSHTLVLEIELEPEKFRKTFQKLIRRHESLRTSFRLVDGQPVQEIHKEVEFEIEEYEGRFWQWKYSESRGIVSERGTNEEIVKNFIRPFRLSQAPLLRVGLINIGKNIHMLIIDMHHIISDGFSYNILIRNFAKLYNGEDLPPIRIQYKDFSEWQNSEKQKEALKQQKDYWLKKLAGDIPVLNMPTDYTRPGIQNFEGNTINFVIAGKETRGLNDLAVKEGTTLYNLLLASFYVLLAKMSGQEDIIIGSTAAGRRDVELEKIIGMFVNTLVLRNYPRGEKVFSHFLREVKEDTINVFENQDYPFEDLVEEIAVKRDVSRNPLFDVMFVFQNIDFQELEIPGMKLIPYEYKNKISKFDLTLLVMEVQDRLLCSFEYCTKLFKSQIIRRLIAFFKKIIVSLPVDFEKKIGAIEIITGEEKEKLLFDMNCTQCGYPRNKTLRELFANQVERTPDRIALVFENRQLSYGALNDRANRLAVFLRKKNVKSHVIVALLLERSIELLVGILAILKAGGVYLPLDPQYPARRIKYILRDSGAGLILLQEHLFAEKGEAFAHIGNENIVYMDNETFYPGEIPAPAPVNQPRDPAYIIYTSGSTGNPKGVLIEHRNVVRLMMNDTFLFEFGDNDVWTLFHSAAFDFSVWEMYGALLYGARLVVISQMAAKDTSGFLELLKRENVTVLNQTPSAFYALNLEEFQQDKGKLNLKYIIFGGEALKPAKLKSWKSRYPGTRLINMYGITETTVHVTFREITDETAASTVSNIGRPLPTLRVYVLDKNLYLQPIGIAGELCVGGDGLGKGYLNNPQLTREKFVENPYQAKETLYRSGDLARIMADGELEYLGRIDQQVKIRGFRIELAEIEYLLQAHREISEAVVTLRENEDGDKYLCGYIVSTSGCSSAQLREYLSRELPAYMLPSYFVSVETIPLTSSGKIDYKSLPDPEVKAGKGYMAPGNEIERKLVEIWGKILLLEQENIGIRDNFFDLGGHSLKAVLLLSEIHKELNVKIPLAELFRTPTIKELSSFIKEISTDRYAPIEPLEKKDYYALSSAQKRLYIIQQMDLKSTVYNMPEFISLEGPKPERLICSFKQLIRRHESLRTSFHMVKEQPVQRIHDDVEFKLEHYELAAGVGDTPCRLPTVFARPFDFSQAPLLRVGLLKMERERAILLVDMHHIISDGVSHEILLKDFTAFFEGENLPPLRIQYKDFSQWQNKEKQKEILKHQETYWLKEFENEIPVLDLPTDYPRPAIQSFEGDFLSFELGSDETAGLKELVLKEGATLYILLLSIINVLLSRLCRQEDIVIGTLTAGRRHSDLKPVMGMFVNTLAVRNYPVGEKTFEQFFREVKENTLAAFENQEYPFEDLVDKVAVNRDAGRNPLFDVVFVLQNIGEKPTEVTRWAVNHTNEYSEYEDFFRGRAAKFELTLSGIETADKLSFNIVYCTRIFKPETIERFIIYFKKIISMAVEEPGMKLCRMEIVTLEEKRQVLFDFNYTGEYPADKTIHELFEEQAVRTPDNIALKVGSELHEMENTLLTYRELNKKSDRLAYLLRETGVGRDTIVALLKNPSIQMIVSIMAVLKAGGAYLPLDPEYPGERINYMLADSGAKVLLEEPGTALKVLSSNSIPTCPVSDPTNLAYIIYTSGTTGKPKGVMIQHKNVVRLLHNDKFQFDFNDKDVWTMFHSYCFDFSVWEMYGALLYGARLVVIPRMVARDTVLFLELLKKESVTILNQTPPAFYRLFEEELKQEKNDLYLKYVIFGGEALNPLKLKALKTRYPDTRLINMFGITETTVHVTYKEIAEREIDSGISNIGKSIPTLRTYVMDSNLNLVPIGVPGELCVSGEGVGRGYLNRPELTAEKFEQDLSGYQDYRDEKKERAGKKADFLKNAPGRRRLYKSGDLVRILADGDIEYLGRIDQQVKIRGYRIELKEIESRLLEHSEVTEAVVLMPEDKTGDKYLCAYLAAGKELAIEPIRQYLAKYLPNYMIPSYFVQIESIPLTPNGKVDQRALPAPGITPVSGYAAPRTKIEERLVEIWNDVLISGESLPGHPGKLQGGIGIRDNFFELGGHSLKAVTLISRIRKEFDIRISLAEIFRFPTIERLSDLVKEAAPDIYAAVDPVETREYYALSSAQKRLYILQQMDKTSTAYNIPQVIQLAQKPGIKNLKKILLQLMERHEALRTSFLMINEEPVQRVIDLHGFEIEYYKINENRLDEIIDNFIRPFELSDGPLLRVCLVNVESAVWMLLLDMHHIVTDGISREILEKEFNTLNSGEDLPPLRLRYKDYAVWQNGPEQQKVAKCQESYWLRLFSGELPVLRLPSDYERPAVQSFEGSILEFELSPASVTGLNTLMRETGVTLYITLSAVYNVLLAKISGQEDIVIGTPVMGRSQPELEKIVGMFVNTLAMRNYPYGEKLFKEFLNDVKERTTEAFENQEYPFEDLVERVYPGRDTSRNPLFDVMFGLDSPVISPERLAEVNISGMNVISSNDNYKRVNKTTKFDLILTAGNKEDRIICNFTYGTRLFKEETIGRFTNYFKKIIDTVGDTPGIKIADIEILTPDEKKQVLLDFNDTAAYYPDNMTLHRLFYRQVEKTPDHVSVVSGDKKLTYGNLNEKSNQLARQLRYKGISGGIVGIMADRSLEMVVGILAILKAGAAYLPIDRELPGERIKYILQDSRAKALLWQKNPRDREPDLVPVTLVGTVSTFFDLDDETLYTGDLKNPGNVDKSSDLAYLMYTSGTGGLPKGVMVEHKSVVNLIRWFGKNFAVQKGTHILGLSDYTFDPNVEDLFGSLFYGGVFHTIDRHAVAFPETLHRYIDRYQVNIIDYFPGLLVRFLDVKKKLESLKIVISGGEKLEDSVKDRIIEKGYILYNNYGPTEVTVDALSGRCTEDRVSLGRPVANTRCYILDKGGKPVPVGVAGELCIGGAGVARGYLNNVELTGSKFVTIPAVTRERMYRTGDLARWLPNGEIEFLGREDLQVKLRGRRVELEEIESAVKVEPGIEDAAVILKPRTFTDDEKQKSISPLELNDLSKFCRIIEDIPVEQILRCLEEVEAESRQDAVKKSIIHKNENFELILTINGDHFIRTPQDHQRNWVIQRAVEEFKEDLIHLDRQAGSLVKGSERKRIDEDWQSTEAHYHDTQLIIDGQQVMQDWERPLMKKMAQIAAEEHGKVLEIGFGMGISATYMVEMGIKSYTVVECNDDVITHFEKWRKRYPNLKTRLIRGKWQDVEEQLGMYDSIFFDTYPVDEAEFLEYVIKNITFAEHFFPVAVKHLRKGGIFTYYTNEVDTFSRRHQRLVLKYFDTFSLSVVKPLTPPPDCNYWWADSMVVIKAIK